MPKRKPRKPKKKLVIHLEVVPLAEVVPLIDKTRRHSRKVKLLQSPS